MRDPKKIYLSTIRDGDVFKLVDQDGREVWGLQAISVDARVDDVTTFTATACDATLSPTTGRAHVNKNAG